MKYLPLLSLVAVMLLAACAPGTEYRRAETLPPLKASGDLKLQGEDPLYNVPDESKRAVWSEGEDFHVPRPPQLVAVPGASEEKTPPPDKQKVPSEIGEDGNGYPIIMLHTQYAWAWEYVGQALKKSDLQINDRNRDIGIYYVKVPSRYGAPDNRARIKLSRTANGIQVTVLGKEKEALMEREPGRKILRRIHDEL